MIEIEKCFQNETKNRISKIFERIGIYYNRLSGRLNVWNAIDIHRNKSQFNLIFYFFKLSSSSSSSSIYEIVTSFGFQCNIFSFLEIRIELLSGWFHCPCSGAEKKTILDCRQFTCKNFLSDSQLCVHAFTQTRRSKRRRRKKK